MTRQDLFKQVEDAIRNNDYKCIHYTEQKDGSKNIIITLNKDLMCFVNEDGTANIICKGNANMLHIGRMELIDLSIEGAALAEERRREVEEKARLQAIDDMKVKLPRWKEQQAVLQSKIEEAERLAAEAGIAIVQEHIEQPVEAQSASADAEYAESVKSMIANGGGTPIPTPLPGPDDSDKISFAELKGETLACFKSNLEKTAIYPATPWYKRIFGHGKENK